MLIEPLTPAAARDLARTIVETGSFGILEHASERMALRGFTLDLCIAAIRSGEVTNVRFVGTWRYRFETATLAVAVLFESETRLWIVTAYDPRRKRQRD